MTRTLWMRGESGEVKDKLYTFQIKGDANDFANWKLIEERKMKHIML